MIGSSATDQKSGSLAERVHADAAADEVRRPAAFFARQWQAMALALAASVIVVLGIAVATTLSARSRAEAERDAARLATANLEKRLSAAQVAQQQERDARAALAEELARVKKPQVHIPVFALIATRRDASETLPLPAAAQWIIISLERESPPRFDRYEITLVAQDGKKLWQGEAMPSSRETVAFGLHSSLLSPGNYVFQLRGETRTRRLVPVARHSVRVLLVSPDTASPPR